MDEIDELFDFLEQLDVDGFMLSPAYGYSAVERPRDLHDARRHPREVPDVDKLSKQVSRSTSSPVYLEFLKGERDLPCTAWGNPTYNVKGWKGPCYLITDAHHETFDDLMTQDALGELRPRQRPALRALHGPLRLRAVGGIRHQREAERQLQDVDMDAG